MGVGLQYTNNNATQTCMIRYLTCLQQYSQLQVYRRKAQDSEKQVERAEAAQQEAVNLRKELLELKDVRNLITGTKIGIEIHVGRNFTNILLARFKRRGKAVVQTDTDGCGCNLHCIVMILCTMAWCT